MLSGMYETKTCRDPALRNIEIYEQIFQDVYNSERTLFEEQVNPHSSVKDTCNSASSPMTLVYGQRGFDARVSLLCLRAG